jgi:phosphoglucosamine mutase
MGAQSRLFGTDGIRGRANEEPLTPERAVAFGRAVAAKFGRPEKPIVIGRDTRLSGPMLEQAVAAGVAAMGVDVLLVGVAPTPAVAFLTRHLRGCAGVVISASHNSFEDNGLKIFNGDGSKCDDAFELEIETLMLGGALRGQDVTGRKVGRIETWPDAASRYAELAVKAYGEGLDLNGVRVVVDAGNGAAYGTTPMVLSSLGAEVLALNIEPDGVNINADCGSTHPELIQKATRRERCWTETKCWR